MQAADELLLKHPLYPRAHQIAVLFCRQNRKLLGVPKLRERVEQYAALRALGCESPPFTKGECENIASDTLDVCMSALAEATDAVHRAVLSH